MNKHLQVIWETGFDFMLFGEVFVFEPLLESRSSPVFAVREHEMQCEVDHCPVGGKLRRGCCYLHPKRLREIGKKIDNFKQNQKVTANISRPHNTEGLKNSTPAGFIEIKKDKCRQLGPLPDEPVRMDARTRFGKDGKQTNIYK